MRNINKIFLALTCLTLTTGIVGCDKKEKSETEKPEGSGKAKMDPAEITARLEGYQTEIQAEIDGVMKPFADIDAVVTQVSEMPAKLNLKAKDLMGAFKASFDGGKVEVSAKLKVSAEAQAEIESVMQKLLDIKAELAALPDVAAKASVKIGEIAAKATAEVTAIVPALTVQLKNPLMKAEAKVELEGQITAIQGLGTSIQGSAKQAIEDFKTIPAKAAEGAAKMAASVAVG